MEYNLGELWECLADAGPDEVCLVGAGRRLTRQQLDDRASQLAHHLRAQGIGPGDHVGVYSLNRTEFVEALLGCWKIAAVPININWRYVPAELRYVIDDADLVGMIAERKYVPIVDEVSGDFPDLKTFVLIDDGTGNEPTTFIAVDYEAALGDQPTHHDFGVPRSSDDLYVLYTGGTTGMPKGVLWRHEDAFFACLGGGNYYDPIKAPEEIADIGREPALPMTPVITAPLMHGGGQWLTFIALYSGGKAVLYTEPSFEPDKVFDLCRAEQAMTIMVVGDAMGRPLAERALQGDVDVPSLVTIGNGGAMLTKTVKDQLREAFPDIIITDGYGATETGAAGVSVDGDNEISASRFTIDERTAVLDEELRRIEPGSGQRGYLARTGHIPLGYHKDPVKTAETFVTDSDGTRWVIPGDFATVDVDGTLLLFGRGSVSINSGGEKIYPEEVEAACRAHPDVYDAIVVGVPDERFGQKVVALVQLRDSVEPLSLVALQDQCRQHIAGFKLPRELILGPVERTNVGKQDYVWAKRHAREVLGLPAE